jgi:hypothetical protein
MSDHATFDEFYAAYLAAHRSRANRLLHLTAKLLVIAVLALAIWRRNPLWLLAAPVVAVAPCWLGHLLLERNRPTSWTRPAASLLGSLKLLFEPHRDAGPPRAGRAYYSVLADLRMCAAMVGLGGETERAAGRPEARPGESATGGSDPT